MSAPGLLIVLLIACSTATGQSPSPSAPPETTVATAAATSTSTPASPPTAPPPTAPPPLPAKSAGCDAATPVEPGDRDVVLTSGGEERSALVHVPPGAVAGVPVPLVLSFHGTFSDPADQAWVSGFSELADREDFVVAYPAGLGFPSDWNYRGDPLAPDDVEFVTALLERLGSDLCLAPRRTLATGFSAGASLSKVLACALPGRFAAVALVSPVLGPDFGDCEQPQPIATIVFHGLLDPLVPYRGGLNPLPGFEDWPPTIAVADWVASWAAANGCVGEPIEHDPLGFATRLSWDGCVAPVELYRLGDAGHAWPGGNGFEAFGKVNRDVSASEIAWAFLVENGD